MKRLQTILTLLVLAVAVNPDLPACAQAGKSRPQSTQIKMKAATNNKSSE